MASGSEKYGKMSKNKRVDAAYRSHRVRKENAARERYENKAKRFGWKGG
ncbi:hypothetical protein QYZ87_09020 [Porphyromonadaceae bacterium W3.11]|nr:hypothetical protein [Porphyromonadaceae bacterium W3.11]